MVLKKIHPGSTNLKEAGLWPVVISGKVDFKAKTMNRGKEGYFKNDKGVNSSRGQNSSNIYVPNSRSSK